MEAEQAGWSSEEEGAAPGQGAEASAIPLLDQIYTNALYVLEYKSSMKITIG